MLPIAYSYNVVYVNDCDELINNFNSDTELILNQDIDCSSQNVIYGEYSNVVINLNNHILSGVGTVDTLINFTLMNGQVNNVRLAQYIDGLKIINVTAYEEGVSLIEYNLLHDLYIDNVTITGSLIVPIEYPYTIDNAIIKNLHLMYPPDFGIISHNTHIYNLTCEGTCDLYFEDGTAYMYDINYSVNYHISIFGELYEMEKVKIKTKTNTGRNVIARIEVYDEQLGDLNKFNGYVTSTDSNGEATFYLPRKIRIHGTDYQISGYRFKVKYGSQEKNQVLTFSSPIQKEFVFNDEGGKQTIEIGFISSTVPLVLVLGILIFILKGMFGD
jgi:hypothetical protein